MEAFFKQRNRFGPGPKYYNAFNPYDSFNTSSYRPSRDEEELYYERYPREQITREPIPPSPLREKNVQGFKSCKCDATPDNSDDIAKLTAKLNSMMTMIYMIFVVLIVVAILLVSMLFRKMFKHLS
jgi:hypothetical protein